MSTRVLSRSLFLFAALLIIVAPAAAQPRAISGVVRDPQQAVVPGAQVVLTNTRSGATATATTDRSGRYSFTALPQGTYRVEVTAAGFQVARSADVAVAADGDAILDVQLMVAGETESVTVAGRGDEAYRVGAVTSPGSLGLAPILDTPYTVNVIPNELITNGQVKSFKEVSKYLPLVEFQEMQGSEVLRPATRGMQGSNMQNARMDGMGIVVTGGNNMEMLQQIEVLNGLGGAMYGPANPSGMFNFVPKRPTERPVRQVSVGYDNQAVGTVHADVGGRAGRDRMFGYRANLVAGSGESFVNNSDSDRRLVSLAGDVRPFAKTTLDAFYELYNVQQHGFPGWFTYGRANAAAPFILVPEAPDPAREGYGQRDSGLDLHTRITQGRIRHDLNALWHLGVGILDQKTDRDISTQVNALTSNAGNYTSWLAVGFAPRFRVLSNLVSLTGRFNTGAMNHDVAFGSTGYTFKSYSDFANPPAASVRLGTATMDDPVIFPLPPAGIPTHDRLFMSSAIHQQGFNVTDNVSFSRQWSARVALSQDWIWTDNYNNQGTRTGGYNDDGVSPLGSLMFKPAGNMTVYTTLGSSLQQGDVAPGTAANAGEALPPYRTTQVEVGYKVALASLDFSTAVFRLHRPFAAIDVADNRLKVTGDQVNVGVEAMVTGRVADSLVLNGGVTLLDPKLNDTGNVTTDGRKFVGIPAYKSNLLTEYRVPAGINTYLTFNWQLVGRRPIDDINSTYTPAYNVLDLGARYSHPLGGTVATFRVNVNNVADVHYWSTLGPGNITGTNVGSYTAHLGAPRTLSASMEVRF